MGLPTHNLKAWTVVTQHLIKEIQFKIIFLSVGVCYLLVLWFRPVELPATK